ncbi:PLDc N-terminal domain-containing protein [Actinoplanes xinjiangensis]|jgi:hypothetical protein|uniref:Phospholipase D-like protein n=1 Tax=Actinoplanes xinjiangensis TaxID=512350 RepID=A0A316ENF2_9ACTN|nr:PLDc N-terminal domain-containing protein [Actinoplanes xinjiangensis]PWK32396.1 phospholipase D-like protein [Actinoplanes xinjiangensis]GIF44534.1 hypothetical protein Axi01nite_88450 [Actinoplanes xinjiangensis]
MTDLAMTLLGILFWTLPLAAYVAVFAATIAGIVRAPLSRRSRTRWIWLVVLAPGIGIVLWFLAGRPAVSARR